MLKRIVLFACFTCSMCHAQSSLVDLGDGTIKDTASNLIWLKDWNATGVTNWMDGIQGLAKHTQWAEELTFAGSSDWHLPSIDEFSGLSFPNGAVSIFERVSPGPYWSRTESDSPGGRECYNPGANPPFETGQCFGPAFGRDLWTGYAVAVRSANVSVVPEPSTLALLSAGLLGVSVCRRSRHAACR